MGLAGEDDPDSSATLPEDGRVSRCRPEATQQRVQVEPEEGALACHDEVQGCGKTCVRVQLRDIDRHTPRRKQHARLAAGTCEASRMSSLWTWRAAARTCSVATFRRSRPAVAPTGIISFPASIDSRIWKKCPAFKASCLRLSLARGSWTLAVFREIGNVELGSLVAQAWTPVCGTSV